MSRTGGFITALHFLTVFRIRKDHDPDESDLARSMIYFPFVGFLIGFLLVQTDRVMQWLVPDTIGNAVVLAAAALITRALHIDGLADTADGLMGGRDPGSRLSIMRDSRIGTAGVLAVLFVTLLKYACLNSLFMGGKAAALLTAPVFGRWAQMLMMFKATYARQEGMGGAFIGHLRAGGLAAASAMAIGLSAWVIMDDLPSVYLALGLPAAVAAATLLWRRSIVRLLGGVTGDAVGAASELAETLTLVLFVFTLSGR